MTKIYITLLAFMCVLGMTTGARAQESEDAVIATVPHDFIARGLVLPRGTYRVSRVEFASGARHLELSNVDDPKATVLLMPTVLNESKGNPQLSFVHVGDTYFLSGIKTATGAYVIALPKSFTSVAQVKDNGTGFSSGTN